MTPQSRWRRALLSLLLFVLALLIISFALHGKTGFEKTLTRLTFPIGVLWLALTGGAFYVLWQRDLAPRLVASGLWLAFTLAGSSPVADTALRYLESREEPFRPGVDAHLDVLVVLGGGTKKGPHRAQVSSSGDRVVYAAQLYHQGAAKRLITTGDATAGLAGERSDPRAHTTELWLALGVERTAIEQLAGINTFQEIQSLKALSPELKGQRVGLLTSAYHLPRAMRLARAQGLSDLIPVAADYQSNSESFAFVDLLPSAGAFDQFARCQHEFMASLINR